jgi:hypothetical protein|tara:strand:- start:1068 stop:1274 length:207 start_codon:yes stop_codon:yes gene_type:complete
MSEMNSQIQVARKNCANFNNGDCLGCMFKREEDGLLMRIDSKFAARPCSVDKGCTYFDKIVMKGVICT